VNNAYLMTLQGEYLSCRESEALYKELFTAVYTMAEIQIKHICKTRKESMHKDTIATVAEDAAVMIMQRYKRPGWQVRKSFINEVSITCVHFMFDKRYKDRIQYSAMSASLAAETDKASEKARIIATIQLASTHSEGIIKQAQKAKKYSTYLLYVCSLHPVSWVDEHIDDIRGLWEVYHG
jgi:hypothetical protein